ncbi:acyl-CoA carboxylase subunit epsilon [Streptomyces sp. NPDC048420]|uniref:acyl-CoA carboxylase subunit epsilon n=1 Tax=Streptomyces sp. NPDC048420 TaxID=3155755 RepID=UPI00343142C8
MSAPQSPTEAPLFRLVEGSATPEELAALTAVLLSRSLAAGIAPDDRARRAQTVARWRRPERTTGFEGPRSWRSAL